MRGGAFSSVYDHYLEIEKLVKFSDDSSPPPCREILQVLHNQAEFLVQISKRTLWTELDDTISSECEESRVIVFDIKDGVLFTIDEVENLKEKIHSSTRRLKMLEDQCVDGLYGFFSDNDHKKEEEEVSSEIVGVSDVYQKLKVILLSNEEVVTSLVGMPGIGKTTLAKKVFQDPTIVECFDRRVWVRVGKGCQFKHIPTRILAEMDPEEDHLNAVDEKLKLKERLESERCLIVLDDVWDRYMAYLLHPTYPPDKNHHFLHSGSKSRILVISRLQQYQLIKISEVRMRLLDKDESWKLLCNKVFSLQQGLCPPQLEKPGKKIAEKCEGLPLTIVAVAALLSQQEDTPEYWDEVATKKHHQLFEDAYDQISEVLLPSYTYLPRLLQIYFLFMGLFPQNYKIPRHKLFNLWCAGGFIEVNLDIELDDFTANGCLEELVSNSLVMVYDESTLNYHYVVKTCGLHSSLWHLCNKKARETNFSVILNTLNESLDDAIKGHRRLSFHNNVLFGIKDVHKSVETKCASSARSLLCYGPYHQYQVPLCYRLELLRELDAVSIRFYEFPMEVLQLVELRYLTLTLNGMIPPSISKLTKLQFLIVYPHLSIKSENVPSYLPEEIWELKELKHLEVTGCDLPDQHYGVTLESLRTLLNVSASSCTRAVFHAIPRLKELRIQITIPNVEESKASGHDWKHVDCFRHISLLSCLKSLKCVVLNPSVARPIVPLMDGWGIRGSCNVSLSGLGYHWESIRRLAGLGYLEVLKLKNYAFQGPLWIVEKSSFPSLVSLVIEDTDIVEWGITPGAFPSLRQLRLRHCYRLKKIHWNPEQLPLRKIELVDCNPLFVNEVKKAVEVKAGDCVLDIQFSWEKSRF